MEMSITRDPGMRVTAKNERFREFHWVFGDLAYGIYGMLHRGDIKSKIFKNNK